MNTVLADLFLNSKSNRPPLKIGIFLDDLSQPRWVTQAISHIQESNFARIELVIFNVAAEEAKLARLSIWRSVVRALLDSKRRSRLGYHVYSKLDQKLFYQRNDPLDPVDCAARLAGIEFMRVVPVTSGYTHRFEQADIERIRHKDLDVILRFGFNILRGEVLKAAKCGIWSYHHGDNNFYRGGPACFWEMYERNSLSGVSLQVLSEDLDAGLVLEKATFSTSTMPSLIRNRFTPYWGAGTMVIQKLFQLHTLGWQTLNRRAVPSAAYLGKRALYTTPRNLETGRWASAVVLKIARKIFKRLTVGKRLPQWKIAIRRSQEPLYLQADSLSPDSFRWLEPPKGHFYADPFLIQVSGRTFVYFEDFLYREWKGIIACSEVTSDGQLGEPRAVLNLDYHLSYPFVFEHDQQVYMIPESSDNGTVQLYQAEDFPYRWRLAKILFRGNAVDTTLFIHGGVYWFFTSISAHAGIGRNLCLFYSDSLDGEWCSHPCNPISMRVQDARSAGRITLSDGKIIRISQDGAKRYGASINFHEIVTLSKTDYCEAFIKNVSLGGARFLGMHAYDRCGDLEVIDGLTEGVSAREMKIGAFPPRAS